MTVLKRRLYKRGSSFETTIPMPLMFALDRKKRYNTLFIYDEKKRGWYLEFEERQ